MKEKSKSPSGPGENPEPIDMDRFKELSDGDEESLLELLELYLSKTAEQVRDLDTAIETGDASTASRIAHSLVGANAMVGMNAILPLLRALEEQADKNDMRQARLTFAAIHQEFEHIERELKEQVKTLSAP